MKKILHVAYPNLNNSGVPNVIMSIVRAASHKYDFSVLVLDGNINSYYSEEFLNYGTIYSTNIMKKGLISKLLRPIRLFYYMFKLLKTIKFDVVHAHNGYDSAIIMLASKIRKVPIRIVHTHGTGFDNANLVIKLYRKLSIKLINKFSTYRIACSSNAGNQFFGHKNIDFIVIRNAVDFNKFLIEKYVPDKRELVNFTIIGRFTNSKNHCFALEVFSEFLKINSNSIFNIVGFGELEQKIQKKVLDLNITKNIVFHKHDTNIPELLSQTDVFLLPSLWEGLGIVLIEAQLMNVICFTSDVVPKEADIGMCKFLSLGLTPDIWAKHISEYLNNKEKLQVIEKEKTKYSIENVMKDYVMIYE